MLKPDQHSITAESKAFPVSTSPACPIFEPGRVRDQSKEADGGGGGAKMGKRKSLTSPPPSTPAMQRADPSQGRPLDFFVVAFY